MNKISYETAVELVWTVINYDCTNKAGISSKPVIMSVCNLVLLQVDEVRMLLLKNFEFSERKSYRAGSSTFQVTIACQKTPQSLLNDCGNKAREFPRNAH